MELHDPALVTILFYTGSDEGSERLWQAVEAAPAGGKSLVRQQRVTINGATIIQVIVERKGVWETTVWQELAQEMDRWLGNLWQTPPGHPWGQSRVYLGAVVAGLYEEQRLLREGLALPAEPSHPIAHMPVGRLWLIAPPAMQKGESAAATYAWTHVPGEKNRRQLERLLWGAMASFLRVELYLHRALDSLRQYGQDERAALWAALDRVESAAAAILAQPVDEKAEETLRRSCQSAVRELAFLSRRHNLLRSSAYLHRHIRSKLCRDEGSLFSWYGERLNEAAVQWSYDLERGDRAIALAQTALSAIRRPPRLEKAVDQPPTERLPAERPAAEQTLADRMPVERVSADRPHWTVYLVAAAIIALCLVDDSWIIVLVRAGVVILLALITWGWFRLRRR